jgi:nitrile hydratase
VNGIHDMGGMQDMGPVHAEKNEPVFHASWEGRVFALRRAMAAWGKWNIDTTRYEIELVPPVEYLRASYYERQLIAFVELLIKKAFVTREEVESGGPAQRPAGVRPALTPAGAQALVDNGVATSRNATVAARFRPGDHVRARNVHPATHTRLPRYARGRVGTVERDHGVFVFPDSNAHGLGEKPQHVYSVRFAAQELWGERAGSRDAVHLDLWDDYLEQA